ncbi:MAG: choline ABC transporter substrate-binding protein [Geminicoccaceae bacterium]
MLRSATTLAAALALLASTTGLARAADAEACKTVRMSDPGWTDITSTNAILGNLLEPLGYQQNIDNLGVPITFEALKNSQIDAFLGNWMPSQAGMVAPLIESGSMEVLTENLTGIRFTLAVPNYVAEAGIKSMADVAANPDKFDREIYGIESGASANQNIEKIIADPEFGLDGWSLVESSEQAMLSQVDRAGRSGKWIVFLAWEPHPMNVKFPLTYLSGADKYFGELGSTTVRTVTRRSFAEECPNLAKLLRQVVFDVDTENRIMGAILDDGADASDAAAAEIKANPDKLDQWLAGVTTFDGADGAAAVKSELGL